MIPGPVLKRVTGKQSPVVPHCQRLLVASRKEAKAPKAPKSKAKAKAKSKAKQSKKAKGRGKGKGQKTEYAIAKAAFFSSVQLVKTIWAGRRIQELLRFLYRKGFASSCTKTIRLI